MFSQNYQLYDGVYYPKNGNVTDFNYSDGDNFEKIIYDIIFAARDKSLFSPELTTKIWDWSSSCHLSPVRANLMRPIASILNGDILELGSGCGIITRYLGELGDNNITAIEASALRAKTTKARIEDLNNVHVVCDRIENFVSPRKFDIITMIGVLQYSRIFSNFKENAEIEILKSVITHLNQDGVLVIAIQNKLGLKYFAGCPEANTGTPFFGLENRYHSNSIIRFDIEEIKSILSQFGLKHQKILYPFPDYHMPVTIFNEQAMKMSPNFSAIDMIATSAFHDKVRPDWVQPNFMLESVWETVYNAGLAANLSNAFLILASKTDKMINLLNNNEITWHYSADRPPVYVTEKVFSFNETNNVIVKASKLASKKSDSELVTQVLENESYINGRIYRSLLIDIIKRPGWLIADVADWSLKWMQFLCKEAGFPDIYQVNLSTQAVNGTFYDCTPFNCILDQYNQLHYIDKEWHFKENIKLIFIFIRGIISSFNNITLSYVSENSNISFIELIFSIFTHLKIPITYDIIKDALKFDVYCQQIIHQYSKFQDINTVNKSILYEETYKQNLKVSNNIYFIKFIETLTKLNEKNIVLNRLQSSLNEKDIMLERYRKFFPIRVLRYFKRKFNIH